MKDKGLSSSEALKSTPSYKITEKLGFQKLLSSPEQADDGILIVGP